MLNIVCINAGNYQGIGKQYVETLQDMCARNLEEGTPFQFTVFTDDPQEYKPGILKRPLPNPELYGWWHKLSLFKPDLFPDGDRIVYFDLDCLIFGPLDEIVKYDGNFAILRDFQTFGYQSSVMAWKSGEGHEIWTEYEKAWFPAIEGGDQAWIERVKKDAQYLQILFPDRFSSYKMKCKVGPPKRTSVIVFHGEPRPHQIKDDWVERVWKIGGQSSAEMIVVGNTTEEQIIYNVKQSTNAGLEDIQRMEPNGLHAVLVAGGPSLKDNLAEIKERHKQGQIIFAMNGSYQFLMANGITPDHHVMLDAREGNVHFVPDIADCYYASQCHPSVFDRAEEKKCIVRLWHTMEVSAVVENAGCFIGFGSTVGMKSIALVHALGYRKIHLYGYDSCYAQENHHAYPQAMNDNERVIDVQVGDRMFKCAAWMATQADEFTIFIPEILKLDCELSVHGTGLIPYIAKMMAGNA